MVSGSSHSYISLTTYLERDLLNILPEWFLVHHSLFDHCKHSVNYILGVRSFIQSSRMMSGTSLPYWALKTCQQLIGMGYSTHTSSTVSGTSLSLEQNSNHWKHTSKLPCPEEHTTKVKIHFASLNFLHFVLFSFVC